MEANPNRRTRVLCVDDSPDMRAVLRDFLEAEGYEVAEAETAHAALRLLLSERFNLLVTDQMMPDETGSWLLERAQAHGLLANVRAIMITANHQPHLLERPEGVPVFRKPIDVDRFLGTVIRLASGEYAPET